MEKQQQNQPKTKRYIEFSDDELDKIRRLKQQTSLIEVDKEWLYLAELGKHYGWDAIVAARSNMISSEEMAVLVQAARKVDMSRDYSNARSVFIGTASTNAKNPSSFFKSTTSSILKNAEADF